MKGSKSDAIIAGIVLFCAFALFVGRLLFYWPLVLYVWRYWVDKF